jgi:RHS repeat-associated protein
VTVHSRIGRASAGTIVLVIAAELTPTNASSLRLRAARSRLGAPSCFEDRGSRERRSRSTARVGRARLQRSGTHQETSRACDETAKASPLYFYDEVGRLTQVDEGGVPVEAYSYDANGNRLTSTNSAGTFAATYDDQDRIETYGTVEYSFTLNGELLNKTDTTTNESTDFVYDAMGNLREVTLPNGDVIEYLVDGQGRRVGKLYNGVLERAWLWRGQLQPVAELDGAGNVVARFVYAEGVNVPELMATSTSAYRFVKDHLGSVREVVDVATNAVVQQLEYDAWGRVLADTSPGFQPFGFAGGLHDPDTGVVRFGARDYDAESGRWVAKDPIGFDGGINHYEYAASAPTSFADPTGKFVWILPFIPAAIDAGVIFGTAAAVTATAYFAGDIIITATTPVPTGPGPAGGTGDDLVTSLAAGLAAAAATCEDPGYCQRIKEECIEYCSEHGLPAPGGGRFRRCMRTCMQLHGCSF